MSEQHVTWWDRLLCRLGLHDPRLLEWKYPEMVSKCTRCPHIMRDK